MYPCFLHDLRLFFRLYRFLMYLFRLFRIRLFLFLQTFQVGFFLPRCDDQRHILVAFRPFLFQLVLQAFQERERLLLLHPVRKVEIADRYLFLQLLIGGCCETILVCGHGGCFTPEIFKHIVFAAEYTLADTLFD